jgi:hypothetical protein
MRRRRIYTELLPPDELGSEATVRLLSRFGLEPIVALPPAAEESSLGRALHRLFAAGVRVGLWPLLDDSDGYWPSNHNADAFARRVFDALMFAEAAGAMPRTVLIDLEPPLRLLRAITAGQRLSPFSELALHALSAKGRALRTRAQDVFRGLQSALAERGIESFATVMPPIALDVAIGHGLFERLFATEARAPKWDVISPMLYSSLIAEFLPGPKPAAQRLARGVVHAGARLLARGLAPPRASVSLGLVGEGKLGGERTLPDPAELRLDMRAARGSGIDDLALYSLEGVLRSGNPEAWLEPYAGQSEV